MILNFAPVLFENKEYKLYRLNYINDEHLKSLRNNYNTTNSFFRIGNYIYHSPMVRQGGYYEGSIVTCKVDVDVEITKQFCHHLTFRKILESGSVMSSFAPIEFFKRDRNNDLLKDYLEDDQQKQVGFWRGYKVDTRIITNNTNPVYGLVLNIFHVWKIKINCLKAVEMGIELTDRYVEIYDPEVDEIFKIKKILVGQIIAHDDKAAQVKKGESVETFLLEELYLENSSENKEELLEKFLGNEQAEANFSHLANTIQERAGAKGKFEWIRKLLDFLGEITFDNHHGFAFKIEDFTRNFDHLWSSIRVGNPTFIFNQHGNQRDSWHDRGLREYGPFSKESFHTSRPKVVVLFRKRKRGGVLGFVGKFKDGLPNIRTSGKTSYQPYGQGFSSKYRLSGFDIIPYEVEEDCLKDYDRAIRRMIEENDSIDFAIVESSDEFRGLPDHENPYFYTKAKLLNMGFLLKKSCMRK